MLLVALALVALAQVPTQASVGELRAVLDELRTGESGEPGFDRALPRLQELIDSDITWFVQGGAWLAGHHGRTECVPALIKALARDDELTVGNASRAKPAILDALVRLKARVSPDLLATSLEPGLLAPTFLLLARDPERARDAMHELWKAAHKHRETRWAAACALVEWRDPRVGSLLLNGTDWNLEVVVHDPGSPSYEGGGGGGGGWGTSHEVWPPRVF